MPTIQTFLEGISSGPFRNFLELMSLPPGRLGAAFLLLAALMLLNDLIRTALMTEFTRSVLNHVIVNVLTLLPGVILGAVLLYADHLYPERAFLNLALAALLYVAWYLSGTLTWLARKDTEGADVGWMSHGAIITLGCWLASLVWIWI